MNSKQVSVVKFTVVAIEQCHTRLKASEYLARDLKLTETQSLGWVLSNISCADMNEVMQNFKGTICLITKQYEN